MKVEPERLKKFVAVIKTMCQKMKGQKCKAWSKHANRFRAREMGPTVALRALGFLPTGKQVKPDGILEKFIRVWDAVEKEIGGSPPKTISEWYVKMRAAKKIAKQLPAAPRLSGDYLLPWHLRALLRDRMVAAGISKLKINTDATVYQLMHLCPDQSRFLRKVQQYLIQVKKQTGLTVKEFMTFAAEADTPPELLSMWCIGCIFQMCYLHALIRSH